MVFLKNRSVSLAPVLGLVCKHSQGLDYLFLFCCYFREVYDTAMMEETIPEIQRTSLGHVILYLKSMGIHDVLG